MWSWGGGFRERRGERETGKVKIVLSHFWCIPFLAENFVRERIGFVGARLLVVSLCDLRALCGEI